MGISTSEKLALDKMLDDLFEEEIESAIQNKDVSESIWEENSPPVSISEFICSKEFLNLEEQIYPEIKKALLDINDDSIREAIMLLGKGSGKTTSLQIFMLYGIYKLLKLKNPQKFYGLLPNSAIVALVVSVSEKQAKAVAFAGIKGMLELCPWFKDKYEPLTTEIRFDKKITLYCGHSGATSWLGFNTVIAAMDECEFMIDNNNRSVAQQLYRALKGSLITRFPGKYKLLSISSVRNEFSFLYQRFSTLKEDSSLIDTTDVPLNHGQFTEIPKYIRTGLIDELKNLRLVKFKKGENFAIKGPSWMINPKSTLSSYLSDFETDEIGALRDYASVPTNSNTPFFKDPEILNRHSSFELLNPLDESLIINPLFMPNISFKYFFAGDLSVSGDATGISMCHYDIFKNKVVLDFSMRIRAKSGERIDYAPIRDLISRFKQKGFNIKKVVFDQFQSNDSINMLRKQGFDVDQVNYAESFVGCTQLHELIHTEKLEYGSFNTTFIGEAKELQVVNSKRIDHLKSDGKYNSKDAWDSAVNCVYVCIEDHYKNGNIEEDKTNTSKIMDRMLNKQPEYDNLYNDSWIL